MRFTSSGSVSETVDAVVHTADRAGWRRPGPSSASTSVVLPLPLCPTRATLRMFAVGYVFTVEDPHLSVLRRPSAGPGGVARSMVPAALAR